MSQPVHPYGHRSRLLHWTGVALVVAIFVYSGQFVETTVEQAEQRRISHTSYGLLLLVLMAVRVWWRTRSADPLSSYALPTLSMFFARCVHVSLYTLLIAQCLIGGLVVVLGDGSSFFGLFDIGTLPAAKPSLVEELMPVHWAVAQIMLVLIGVHFLAAIGHLIFGVKD